MDRQDEDPVLRAKYRDYCSARVADALLALSPDEVYTLAQSEARATGQVPPETFSDSVSLATGKIREGLNLPEFDEWVRLYRRDPEAFEPFLMGFWESEEPADPAHSGESGPLEAAEAAEEAEEKED